MRRELQKKSRLLTTISYYNTMFHFELYSDYLCMIKATQGYKTKLKSVCDSTENMAELKTEQGETFYKKQKKKFKHKNFKDK